jgi:hypothetical protein
MPTLEKTAGKLALVKLEYHPTIHDMPTDERPRERLKHYGPKALSTAELLAKYGGLSGLMRADFGELCSEHGLGEAKASQLKAALEIGRRLGMLQNEEKYQLTSSPRINPGMPPLTRRLSCFVEACPTWPSPHQVLQPLHRLTPRAPRPTRCLLRYDLAHGPRHTRGRSRHESLRQALPPRGHRRNSVSKMGTIYQS